MISLETDRLLIRNFRNDDWQALQEMIMAYQASDVAKFEDPWPTSDEDMKNIALWFAGGDAYVAACLKATGELVGFVAIERRDAPDQQLHNLGYIFHPAHYGKGYATEACRAAMAYVIEVMDADGFLTGTHPDNTASVRLLKRLGFSYAGNGEYTLSREEWLAKQS
jgi:[ribosomal protein S5]-alanine N-acetyltransferase